MSREKEGKSPRSFEGYILTHGNLAREWKKGELLELWVTSSRRWCTTEGINREDGNIKNNRNKE